MSRNVNFSSVGPADVVSEFIRLRAGGDLTRAFVLAHDDIEFVLHVSDAVLPIGGARRGKATIVADLLQMGAMIDHLVWRPKRIVAHGDVVRVRLEFLYRHRASGQSIEGTCRMLFTVRDGLITRIEEFHDREKMESFFKLVGRPPGAEDAAVTAAPEEEPTP